MSILKDPRLKGYTIETLRHDGVTVTATCEDTDPVVFTYKTESEALNEIYEVADGCEPSITLDGVSLIYNSRPNIALEFAEEEDENRFCRLHM